MATRYFALEENGLPRLQVNTDLLNNFVFRLDGQTIARIKLAKMLKGEMLKLPDGSMLEVKGTGLSPNQLIILRDGRPIPGSANWEQAQAGSATGSPAGVTPFQQTLILENKVKGGIGWFYWIAGLSLINSILYMIGTSFGFIFGLGITQFVDGLASGLVSATGTGVWYVVGFVINLVIAGIFVVLGILGHRRSSVAVIVGMILYGLDGLLILAFGEWLGALFHLFALWGLWTGLKALNQLAKLEEEAKRLGQLA